MQQGLIISYVRELYSVTSCLVIFWFSTYVCFFLFLHEFVHDFTFNQVGDEIITLYDSLGMQFWFKSNIQIQNQYRLDMAVVFPQEMFFF